MKTFLLALLLAASAAAQPILGPEVRSAQIPGAGDVALLPLGNGYVIAWPEADRIQVGHLDATLQATDAPFTILLPAPFAPPTFITLATNGSSILVVWKEKPIGHADSTYAATLTLDAKGLLAPPQFVNATNSTPAVAARDGKYLLMSGDESLVLTDQLMTDSLDRIPPPLASALSQHGDAAIVTVAVTTVCTSHGFFYIFPTCDTLQTFTFTTQSVKKNVAFPFPAVSTTSLVHDPMVAPDGDHFVGLVLTTNETEIFELRNDRPLAAWTLDPLTTPGVITAVGNGSDILVVWWRTPALRGIVLHDDGTKSAPFVIAQYPVYNSPKVFVSSSNEFVVTYRYENAIAGRVIHVQGEKQRAVR